MYLVYPFGFKYVLENFEVDQKLVFVLCVHLDSVHRYIIYNKISLERKKKAETPSAKIAAGNTYCRLSP